MYLDYSALEFDKEGRPEQPVLLLQTLSGGILGALPGVYNLKFNIKFSEPSEIEFDLPAWLDAGVQNPMYDAVRGYRAIYTKRYGVYVIMNPETSADGVEEVKHVTGYSIEKLLDTKTFFLEEGTFKFYNRLDKTDGNTIIGRILEIAPDWDVDYVAPAIERLYRTFDQYDDDLLTFVYGNAPEKYRCVFVFDSYQKKFSVYDADAARDALPIYLDFDNLVQSVRVYEQTDDMFTVLMPYGADELDIRAVNPTGENRIYDVSYFIEKGDITGEPVTQWGKWQSEVRAKREYYMGVAAMQASASARILSMQAACADLQGALDSLISQQSITVQQLALETTESGRQSQQRLLDQLKNSIRSKREEIERAERAIAGVEQQKSAYAAKLQAVADRLAPRKYFSGETYAALSPYFIESTMTDDTFVGTSVDEAASGELFPLSGATLRISASEITMVDLRNEFSRRMFLIEGGRFSVTGNHSFSGDVIRGTADVSDDGSFVLTVYAGSLTADGTGAPNGLLTVSGALSGRTDDVRKVMEQDVEQMRGTQMEISCASGDLYMTVSVSEYQKFSVQMELYDYAEKMLADAATPYYEFEIDSGNLLFAREFSPFRDKLELGSSIYLRISDDYVIEPLVIEVSFDFEDYSKFSMVFSNRFKRNDPSNTLKDLIQQSVSYGRTIDASRHAYNQAVSASSKAAQFIHSALLAAKNKIYAADNQSVVLDGNGMTVGKDGSPYQIRVVNDMIALIDGHDGSARLAIGLFETPGNGAYFGVNADVIAGRLMVGTEMMIATNSGHFQVDDSGVYIDSMKFYIRNNGGKSLDSALSEVDTKIDVASRSITGTIREFYNNGTLDAAKLNGVISAQNAQMRSAGGNVLFDRDGLWLLNAAEKQWATRAVWMNDRGILFGTGNSTSDPGAESSGWTWTTAINHDGIVAETLAGKTISGLKITGADAEFTGTLRAAKLEGTLKGFGDGGWIDGCGLRIGKKDESGQDIPDNYQFYVDKSGNAYLSGALYVGGSSFRDTVTRLTRDTVETGSIIAQNLRVNAANITGSISAKNLMIDSPLRLCIRGTTEPIGYLRSRYYDEVGNCYALTSENSAGEVLVAEETRLFTDLKRHSVGYVMLRARTSRDIFYEYIGVDHNGPFATSNVRTNSDRRYKHNIRYDLEGYDLFFDRLKPCSFILNHNAGERSSIGFIAQDVRDALYESSLNESDFDALKQSGADGKYSLAYSDFIGLCVRQIQMLKDRVSRLETISA